MMVLSESDNNSEIFPLICCHKKSFISKYLASKLLLMKKFLLGFTLLFFSAIAAYGQCGTKAKFVYKYIGCSTIQFTDSSTTSSSYKLVTWKWNFGDGSTALGPKVSHTFKPGANVQVKLLVTAEDTATGLITCQDSISQNIIVRSLPTVHVESSPNPACLGEAPLFTGTSNHGIKSWQWIFGDGDTVNLPSPVHQYADTGSYNVVLHVMDSAGCANQNDTVYIQRINSVPSVDFTWNPNLVTTVDNDQFYGSSNATATATTIAWHWNFGDGDTANVQNPTHNYPVAGQDTVKLTVDVNGTCTNTVAKVLDVHPLPSVNFTYNYLSCSRIQFNDSSTAAPNYTLVKWHWNFGDGDTTGGPNVAHTFAPGTSPRVSLVVWAQDSLGNIYIDSTYKNINIHTLPSVHIQSDPNPSCLQIAPQFSGTSNHPIKSWHWIFGDGDTANIARPVHQYADTGSYNVILHVVDSLGCANQNDSVYMQKIEPNPKVDFTWNPDPATTIDNIQFNGTSDAISKSTTISWHWNFGDGDTANVQNPTHNFSKVGQDTVTLSIEVNGLCSSSISKVVTIYPYVKPNFTYSVSCLNDLTYFTDSSTTAPGTTIQTWKWYWGDGDSTIINSPNNPDTTHLYVTQAVYPVTLVTVTTTGFERRVTKNVTVVPKPTAFFTFNDTCYRNPTSFYDQSSTNGGSAVTSWHWTFGDGDSASVRDTMHTYAYPGSYPVTLYIQNADGCRDTVQRTVVMDSLPAVDFTMSTDTVCQGGNVTFTGLGKDIRFWHWDFGNGDTSSYRITTEKFTSPGTDTITLTVKDTKGCSSFVYHTIYVRPAPIANFDFTILCKSDTTCFLDKSTIPKGYIKSWHWNFGDTDTSALQNPNHYYVDQNKNYNATLTVTSNENCKGSDTQLIIFDSLPVPKFVVSNACMSDYTNFVDESTSPGISTITTRKWYFGDGDSLIVTNPNQSTAKHIYKDTTTYDVTLIVSNTFGKTDTVSQLITVHKKPFADFTFNDTCYTKPITFTDRSKKDGGSSLSAWNWNFGDPLSGVKNTDTVENPTHAMSYPGSYNVRLIVSNTNGCSDTAIRSLVVDSLPDPAFTVSKDTMCLGEKAYFYGTGKDIVSWHWDFGNGDTSSYQKPVYTYPNPGTYVVTLTVKNLKGCSNFFVDTVFVDDNPKAAFTIGPSCAGDSTYFYDKTSTSYGYPAQWQWNFGDSTSSSNQSSMENPAHHFTKVGSYVTKLLVTDNYGCVDSVSHYVNVYDHPKAAFSYHQACNPATRVDFTDQSVRSSSKSPITSYLWTFYQEDTSTLQNPSYRYPHYDSCYQVTLRVTDTNGCHNVDTVKVCLRDSLTTDFTTAKVCLGVRTPFTASYNPYNDSIASYTWNFGDGSNKIITYHDTISHVFPHPGTYNVTLSAVDTNGCEVSITHQAMVDSLPKADFTYMTPACDQPTYFQGVTHSGGNFISTWRWDFGDTTSGVNDSAYTQNPSHRYVSFDSTYQVKLIVKNFNGCIDSVTKPVIRHSCLHVLYTVHKQAGCANNPVYFKDLTTLNSSQGAIDQWNWDFGDGNTETYTSHKDSIVHVYTSPGTYHVTLKVTATDNNVTYSESYDSIIQMIHKAPVADFNYNNPCVSQEAIFTDATQTFDSNISQWQWTFNDPYAHPDTSAVQNPTHVYNAAGTYPAQLVVVDDNNCYDTVTKPVTVYDAPVAAFTITQNYNDVTGQVLLNNSSTGATQYLWSFGDGGTSTDKDPAYQYQSVGVFKILLTATNGGMCSDTTSKYIDLTSGLYVPNSFAPESIHAGIKLFKPKGINLLKYDVRVYNMWGDLLWESTKLNAKGEPVEGWDGTFEGKPMPEGNYIWRIKAKFLDGSVWKGSDNGDGNKKSYGTVFLIR